MERKRHKWSVWVFKKTWSLFHKSIDKPPSKEELKTLHKTIKKVTEDIENYSFNTVISTFMIAVNEWNKLPQISQETMKDFVILLSPFAPHFSEELWFKLGYKKSISFTSWPTYDESFLVENNYDYPVSFNGKMRFKISLPLSLTKDQIEEKVTF